MALTGTDGKYIGPVLDALTDAGCEICRGRDTVTLRSEGRLRAVSEIATAPYPGFPTDVQAPMMAALLRARGESRFAETIFERRFAHVAQLRTMLESDEPMGRKMDFLIQEVNRESNTIGSKCSDVAIAEIVVALKAEVEKMREQVQNVE